MTFSRCHVFVATSTTWPIAHSPCDVLSLSPLSIDNTSQYPLALVQLTPAGPGRGKGREWCCGRSNSFVLWPDRKVWQCEEVWCKLTFPLTVDFMQLIWSLSNVRLIWGVVWCKLTTNHQLGITTLLHDSARFGPRHHLS